MALGRYELNHAEIALVLNALRLDIEEGCECWECRAMQALIDRLDPKPKRVKKEGWVNVYRNETVGARIHTTEQEALKGKSIYDWVTCIRIEWEEDYVRETSGD